MTTFTPLFPIPETPKQLKQNRIDSLRVGAIQYHQPGAFRPITHWSELTKQSENGSIEE